MTGSASFFEKKEAKKLSLPAGFGTSTSQPPRSESFLLLFFKKEALSFPSERTS
jgi:hypothetical protein